MRPAFRWSWLGRVPYGAALTLMRSVWSERREERIPDTLLLLEHPPVFTIGKSGSRAEIRTPQAELERLGFEVHEVDRGGRVTYHGPGQLVAYPIFSIGTSPIAATELVRRLVEVMRALLGDHGIESHWDPAHPGLWIGEEKIGAVGIRVEGGVSRHGFALNVQPDLAHFAHIVPCGITDRGVTSLARLLDRPVPLSEIVEQVPGKFTRILEREATIWAPDSSPARGSVVL
jgi:lipoyl(octanoyl) transferase